MAFLPKECWGNRERKHVKRQGTCAHMGMCVSDPMHTCAYVCVWTCAHTRMCVSEHVHTCARVCLLGSLSSYKTTRIQPWSLCPHDFVWITSQITRPYTPQSDQCFAHLTFSEALSGDWVSTYEPWGRGSIYSNHIQATAVSMVWSCSV